MIDPELLELNRRMKEAHADALAALTDPTRTPADGDVRRLMEALNEAMAAVTAALLYSAERDAGTTRPPTQR